MASRPSARRIFRTTTRAMTRVYRSTFLLLFTALTFASTAAGQAIEPRADGTPVVLTLDEAVQIALVQNHVLRSTALDLETADAQIREAWGQLLPQVDISSSYTRNVVTANPFAGSEAGGLFASFGFVDWLAYNEQARMDDDPSTEPLPLDEFMDRRRQGMAEIGAAMGDSGNPFGVENQFVSGITAVPQTFKTALGLVAGLVAWAWAGQN